MCRSQREHQGEEAGHWEGELEALLIVAPGNLVFLQLAIGTVALPKVSPPTDFQVLHDELLQLITIYVMPLGCKVTSAELRAPLGPGLWGLHLPAPEGSACSKYSIYTAYPCKLLRTLCPQFLTLESPRTPEEHNCLFL